MDEELVVQQEDEIIDIAGVMKLIPHRYPFLMIDRVLDIVPGESAVGVKNVSVNEPHFQGHFPSAPVMPGVLIIEAMAQTSAVLVVRSLGGDWLGKLIYFMSIEGARFRRPVVPGDVLHLKVLKNIVADRCGNLRVGHLLVTPWSPRLHILQ